MHPSVLEIVLLAQKNLIYHHGTFQEKFHQLNLPVQKHQLKQALLFEIRLTTAPQVEKFKKLK